MAHTPEDFAKKIGPLLDRLVKESIGQATQAMMSDLYTDLVNRTPEDTGHAKENWHVTLNQSTNEEYPLGSNKAMIDAMSIISSNPFSNNNVRKVVFTNTALSKPTEKDGSQFAYMRALEDGHSPQAPNGVVELSIRTMIGKYSSK